MANIKRANTSGITKTGTAIADVPDAPTIGTATISATTASVTYTAAATGGAVTTFTATSTPGSITGTGSSPITVSGLSSGTSYTFTVSATNSTGTNTSAASNSVTATTPTFGYRIGGMTATATNSYSTSIDKFNQNAETMSQISNSYSATNGRSNAGLTNSGVAVYAAGGYAGDQAPAERSQISKVNVVTDALSTLGATLVTGNGEPLGISNTGTAGYICGGYEGVSSVNRVQKLNYSNEANSNLGAVLGGTNRGGCGWADAKTTGYAASGYDGSAWINIVRRVTFSNDTFSTVSGPTATMTGTAFSDYGVAGYNHGNAYNGTNEIKKFTFSTTTYSTLPGLMGTALYSGAASQGPVAGYQLGGQESSNLYTTCQKLVFSTGTSSILSAVISAACSNSTQGATYNMGVQ
jgi:hypothetical protein